MIYDLVCESDHRFEGWFKNLDDYAHQLETHILTCPICDSHKVHKVPSASYISKGTESPRSLPDPLTLSRKLHAYVEKNFQQVGTQFADEARKMHYGETEERNITGTATREEVQDLTREGINTIALPPKVVAKDKLN